MFRVIIILLIVVLFSSICEASAQHSWVKELPGVGTFSSPRATDLNGDGVGDIIMGAGRTNSKLVTLRLLL